MTAMVKPVAAAAAAVLLTLAPAARAADIIYSLRIEGVDPSEYSSLAPGEYTLQIWGEVLDNDLGGGFTGGILQYAVQLDAAGDNVTFVPQPYGVSPWVIPPDTWASRTADPAIFVTRFAGLRNVGGHDVFAETGAMSPNQFDTYFDTYGAGAPSLLAWGPIEYEGGPFEIEVSALVQEQVVYGPGPGAEYPDNVYGYRITPLGGSVVLPEPSALLLAAIPLMVGPSRRRARPPA